jgi:serine/tyrosine/threonine adenylyltransferase
MQFTHSYQSLPATFYSNATPSVAVNPQTVLFNTDLAKELGIDLSDKEIAEYLSGQQLHSTSLPIALAYAGHQFGHFTMLGDGRAILLGEVLSTKNELFDVQLKGAGATAYSRRGDGKLALSSALREYIYSESMHALGIATTRSLAVVATGAPVYRQIAEPGAVLTRIAQSHIRVGTFEYVARFGNLVDAQALVNYTINRHYPHLQNEENVAVALLQMVIEKQMKLIVQWMRVGFIHGVLNTDNVSIACQTIDYGPCAFMNAYNPATVYSQIDSAGRYAFGQQPQITHWNLVRFAEALLPMLHPEKEQAIALATSILQTANSIFEKEYTTMLYAKIGIENNTKEQMEFIGKLLQWMQENEADYTNSFLQLMGKDLPKNELYDSDNWKNLINEWHTVLEKNNVTREQALVVMQKNNPNYIPRNTNVDALINDCLATGNTTEIYHFLAQMKTTYQDQISDNKLCSYPSENGFSTHCNT